MLNIFYFLAFLAFLGGDFGYVSCKSKSLAHGPGKGSTRLFKLADKRSVGFTNFPSNFLGYFFMQIMWAAEPLRGGVTRSDYVIIAVGMS